MYNSAITRKTPALFIILIDLSGSMDEKVTLGRKTFTKAELVASATNGILTELIHRCMREEGIRDYFHLCVIGYSGQGVQPLLGHDFSPISSSRLALMDRPRRKYLEERVLPDGSTNLGELEETLWITPAASGTTPMYAALLRAHSLISRWCSSPENGNSFPPVLVNVSDGAATDASPDQLLEIAHAIRELGTMDGNTLMLNIHITSEEGLVRAVFPASIDELPVDRHAALLYEMSSEMPSVYEGMVRQVRGGGEGPFRGVSYNTPLTELVAMMNIGSMSVTLIR